MIRFSSRSTMPKRVVCTFMRTLQSIGLPVLGHAALDSKSSHSTSCHSSPSRPGGCEPLHLFVHHIGMHADAHAPPQPVHGANAAEPMSYAVSWFISENPGGSLRLCVTPWSALPATAASARRSGQPPRRNPDPDTDSSTRYPGFSNPLHE